MKVMIIGNGISGITAARYLRKASDDVQITVISDESPYFIARTALMYVYMKHMQEKDLLPYESFFWEKNRIDLCQDRVVHVDAVGQVVSLQSGQTLPYDRLILAVGSKIKMLQVPGNDLAGIEGFYALQDLHRWQEGAASASAVAIVGGGLIGVELAEMMIDQGKQVYMILRESSYWRRMLPEEESHAINQHLIDHGVTLLPQKEVKKFEGKNGRVQEVHLVSGEILPVQWVGMSIGVQPRIHEFFMAGLEVEQGILVNPYLETSCLNVYAIGDCAQVREPIPGRPAIEAMWYTGKSMGEYVATRIMGNNERYSPGLYFNSAKFFDLEYQIYGYVPTESSDPIRSFVWMSDDQTKIFRIAYEPEHQKVVGVSGLGIRLRQETWTQWIKDKIELKDALNAWEQGCFDPEFTPEWGKKIRHSFSQQTGYTFPMPTAFKLWNWLKK